MKRTIAGLVFLTLLCPLSIFATDIITVVKTYAVGDEGPAGGIVFYDKGSESDGWRYLEAAPKSTEWGNGTYGISWGGWSKKVRGTGAGIGSGKGNTEKIVARLGRGDYAARLCFDLVYGGYDNWFLPSIDELDLMYINLYEKGLGGFSDVDYWSSSEYNNNIARVQDFYKGVHGGYLKYTARRVRAVRAF